MGSGDTVIGKTAERTNGAICLANVLASASHLFARGSQKFLRRCAHFE